MQNSNNAAVLYKIYMTENYKENKKNYIKWQMPIL